MADHIIVVAAVIEQAGRFLITRRLKGTHLAGYWEFPGGKVPRKIFDTSHAYPERTVELHFYRGDLTAEPEPMLGQELRWIAREEFGDFEFPPADAELIDGLINASL